MKDYKVLLDLSTIISGGNSYAGIPQDTRLLFKIYSEMPGIKPTGLICSEGGHNSLLRFKLHPDNKIKQTLSFTDYFFNLEGNVEDLGEIGIFKRFLLTMEKQYDSFRYVKRVFQKNYPLHPSDPSYADYIWRRGFHGLINSRLKEMISKQDFVLTIFNKYVFSRRMLLNLEAPKLHTPGMDFAVFQSDFPQCPEVSEGTIPIVRFHHCVPLRYPDTLPSPKLSKVFSNSLLKSAKHAAFVCNSEPARQELLKLMPALDQKAFVIPPVLSTEYLHVEKNIDNLSAIVDTRRCDEWKKNVMQVPAIKGDSDYSNYIISVSTLELRKNLISLIRAWEKIRYTKDSKLKLIVVGTPRWKCENLISAMRPHIIRGDIIHLEKMPLEELNRLYACAKAFVLPTFYEGFGTSPIEAMHAGCPVIVSNIPTTRWVLGDAALYCDPYDISSISDTIENLLYSPNSQATCNDLINRGYQLVSNYSSKAISEQWLALFENLKSKSTSNVGI